MIWNEKAECMSEEEKKVLQRMLMCPERGGISREVAHADGHEAEVLVGRRVRQGGTHHAVRVGRRVVLHARVGCGAGGVGRDGDRRRGGGVCVVAQGDEPVLGGGREERGLDVGGR